MKHSLLRMAAALAGLCVVVASSPAHAIINQVDGTIVPVTGRLQSCMDKATTQAPVGGDGPGVMNAVRDAATLPQTFLPNPTGPNAYKVTFYDVGEGAGYQDRFGWYHVGDSPFTAGSRHEVFDCRSIAASCDCPCLGGARGANGPTNTCTTWVNANTVTVDFNCLHALASTNANYWNGGPIAFYLLTPELVAGGSTGNCAAVNSTTNRVYSTDNTINDDGDFVHFLVYTSRSFAQTYYFGFEDLFRGGDNDFEDMLVRANGLVPTCNPSPEVCDGMDNNCDGVIDNFTRPCSTACGSGTQTCTAGSFGACTARSPATETCDNVDNNCNGQIDEGLSRACTGACGAGTQYCSMGVYGTCVTTRSPTAEICDNVDNNCNGMVDEGLTRPCTSTCGTGTEVCTTGTWGACSAPGPGVETCNGLDDDCDGTVDDHLTDPGLGVACTPTGATIPVDSTGHAVGVCRFGTLRCRSGRLSCDGAVTPQPETCNNLDDDCNGTVDNGVPGGGTCGRAVGACMAGSFVCEMGTYVCRGTTTGSPETCNGIDDDCDGVVDNGVASNGPCSVTDDGTHLCMAGELRCVSGGFHCVGGTRGSTETCDCMDNDCDGTVDNTPPGGSLCPSSGSCIACACRTPCSGDSEFPCSVGLECRAGFCVPPTCGGVMCADGQVCNNNACVDPCSLITCNSGQTCRNGRCMENSCYVLGCTDPQQTCINGTCVANPCHGVTCTASQFCRDGTCVGSCATVSCDVGTSCRDGACVADPCDGVVCAAGQICQVSGTTGSCIPNPCANMSCGNGRICQGGTCVDDPCARITCPGSAVVCRAGQCVSTTPVSHVIRDRGVATGGGGFSCAVRDAGTQRNGALGAFAMAAALVATRRRGRRRAPGRATVGGAR